MDRYKQWPSNQEHGQAGTATQREATDGNTGQLPPLHADPRTPAASTFPAIVPATLERDMEKAAWRLSGDLRVAPVYSGQVDWGDKMYGLVWGPGFPRHSQHGGGGSKAQMPLAPQDTNTGQQGAEPPLC